MLSHSMHVMLIRDDYGVELYTIAVDVDDADAETLLEDCAGDANNSFSVSSGELGDVFEALAKRTIHLSK